MFKGVLREIGTIEENLRESFESKIGVAKVTYDGFLDLACKLGEKTTAWHVTQSRDVEAAHHNSSYPIQEILYFGHIRSKNWIASLSSAKE